MESNFDHELIPAYDDFKEKELEVLGYIAEGWTNEEIAQKLVISVNTVRWYNKQIYSKLGVHSRTLAVARARELGILDTVEETAVYASPFHQRPVAPVAELDEPTLPPQRIYFTKAHDGVKLAYALVGEGAPLVKTANYMSHLDYDWQSPIWHHWLEEFSRGNTFIRYDERGTGLSDWAVMNLSFEARVRDLETVVDSLDLDTFPLLGISQGGPVAMAYAVRHPERVSQLILYGTYARGRLHRNLTEDEFEEARTLISLIRMGWAKDNPAYRQAVAMQYLQDGTPEQWQAMDELARMSMCAENAILLEQEAHHVDVRHLASAVEVPTLVMHCRDDAAVPFEEGRLLAALIPNAQFVSLEGKNHIITPYEAAWPKFVSEIRQFLGMAS